MTWSAPTDDVVRIQCWSGPRNISTALMYSWRQRTDTTVVDEPFYGHYLTIDDRGHPGVEAVLASQSHDADEVIAAARALAQADASYEAARLCGVVALSTADPDVSRRLLKESRTWRSTRRRMVSAVMS